MSIYNPLAVAEIFKAITAENTTPVALTPDSVKLTNVVVNGATATATLEGIRYGGLKHYKNFTYHRISIESFFKNTHRLIKASEAKSTKDILNAIAFYYGLFLTESDIVDHPVSYYDPEQDFVYECTLEIIAGHPLYYGTVVFHIEGIQTTIDDMIIYTDVDAVKDTSPHVTGKLVNTYNTWGVDYSAHSEYLKTYAAKTSGTAVALTDAQAKELVNRLSSVDGQPWTYTDSTKAFNLKGASILYHRATADFIANVADPTAKPNEQYQYVMLIVPSAKDLYPTLTNNWGYFIHYDDIGSVE